MSLSTEALLFVAILGLYLYDSSLLLYCNEVILTPSGVEDWHIGFGSSNMGVGGRELFIPNPLLIHRPMFRLSWSFEHADSEQAITIPRSLFSPLEPMVWAIAIGLLVFLPLGFFTRLGDLGLLLAVLLIYGNIVIALVWAWLNRKKMQLPMHRFVGMTFEFFVCPPFALNMIRHLSLQMPVAGSAVAVARRLQRMHSWDQTRAILLTRLESELTLEEPGSERYQRVLQRKESLLAERKPCQE